MRYARIENNKVMEIIDFNPVNRFTDEIVAQFVECNRDTEQHMEYINGVFERKVHVKTAEEQKQLIHSQLEDIDKKSVRDSEDLIELLVKKGIISLDELPFVKSRKNQKQTLRTILKQEV
jgi:hypothetical protein